MKSLVPAQPSPAQPEGLEEGRFVSLCFLLVPFPLVFRARGLSCCTLRSHWHHLEVTVAQFVFELTSMDGLQGVEHLG